MCRKCNRQRTRAGGARSRSARRSAGLRGRGHPCRVAGRNDEDLRLKATCPEHRDDLVADVLADASGGLASEAAHRHGCGCNHLTAVALSQCAVQADFRQVSVRVLVASGGCVFQVKGADNEVRHENPGFSQSRAGAQRCCGLAGLWTGRRCFCVGRASTGATRNTGVAVRCKPGGRSADYLLAPSTILSRLRMGVLRFRPCLT
jgi:hypothetical protein